MTTVLALLASSAIFAQTAGTPVTDNPPTKTTIEVPVNTEAKVPFSFVDLRLGTGEWTPKEGDVVTIGFVGTLQSNGSTFDSTKEKPPFAFKIGSESTIKGIEMAVMGMKVGGKRIAQVPSEFAYGTTGAANIPANSNLLFELELLRIDRPDQTAKVELTEVTPGKGQEAKAGDVVEVHYVGTFMNGRKFDSSRDRGQALSFELGAKRVISGFDQGVTGMKVGGKRVVVIPYMLAYGEDGRSPVIPRFATLVFELELVKIRSGSTSN